MIVYGVGCCLFVVMRFGFVFGLSLICVLFIDFDLALCGLCLGLGFGVWCFLFVAVLCCGLWFSLFGFTCGFKFVDDLCVVSLGLVCSYFRFWVLVFGLGLIVCFLALRSGALVRDFACDC